MMRSIVVTCAAVLISGAAAAAQPDLILTGELTYQDYNHYREVPFTVPEGVDRVTVDFSQDGAAQRTTVDLGIADPHRFRGWSGGNKSHFTLAAADATPSYLPGPIEPGTWRLILGIPNIRPDVTTHYRAEISFNRPEDLVLKEGPAWYRGDLHMHTAHSDGFCRSREGKKVNCPVFRTVEAAEAAKLDFIFVSDHNATSHYQDLRELQPFFDDVLLLPGREMTTFHGHANELGARDFIEFRIPDHLPDATALAAEVHRAGGLFSLNHPNAPTGEQCMGCGWDPAVFDLSAADAVEVVNGGSVREAGERSLALPFWRAMLDKGLHPTAVGGSDNHDADLPTATSGSVGSPATVVWAANLSERAILDGIKAGHVFVQIRGGGRVELTAGAAMMGDHFPLAKGGKQTINLHVAGVEGGHVEVLSDNPPEDLSQAPLTGDDRRSFTWRGDGRHHWLAVLIHDKDGQAALLSNPLYAEPKL